MPNGRGRVVVAFAAVAAAAAVALLTAPRTMAQTATAETHKQWMNDASDAQDDFRFAVAEKKQNDAVDALTKLEALMGRTEDYWSAKKAADGVKLTKETRVYATQALTAAKAGDLAAATTQFDKMGASCNTCHELHL